MMTDWFSEQVLGQQELHRESLSQTPNSKTNTVVFELECKKKSENCLFESLSGLDRVFLVTASSCGPLRHSNGLRGEGWKRSALSSWNEDREGEDITAQHIF